MACSVAEIINTTPPKWYSPCILKLPCRRNGVNVRGMVFINPGNPTGQCLTVEDLKALIKFAYEEKVVLMADEVYAPNVYQVSLISRS